MAMFFWLGHTISKLAPLRLRNGWGSHSPQVNTSVPTVVSCETLAIFTILCYTDFKILYHKR